jgi:4-coumarate--CoA ligase (photoactive yellow protein activation family)
LELIELATALAETVQMRRSGLEDYLLARRRLADWAEVVAASLDRYAEQMVFWTSGSTGTPKACEHRLLDLVQETELHARAFRDRRRIVAYAPCHHIYGFLFTVLLAARLKAPVVDARDRIPGRLGERLQDGDLVVGHPSFWSSFVRSGAVAADVIGLTSTAPCPDDVAQAVAALGVRPLVQVYGSTETAGIASRNAADEDFRLFPFWERVGASDAMARRRADGSQALCSPPDHLAWSGDRSFRIAGRVDAAVQVGGYNVYPGHVAARLREHPAVGAAAVRLMAPAEGDRLKAFVAPRQPGVCEDLLRRELSLWCHEHLTAPERPRAFSFGAELPTNEQGKLVDWPVSWPVDG